MKKLLSGLLGFGLWLGLLAPSLAVVLSTQVGNVAYSITPTDTTVTTTTVFTASRTWTLPNAASTCIGQNCQPAAVALQIIDTANAISVAFPLVIAPASGETINGSTNSITIPSAGARILLWPVTGSGWKYQVEATLGYAVGTNSTVWHTGNSAPVAVTTGTDATAINTQTVITEVFVPVNGTITGVKWLGLASSTGNVQFSLADSTGAIIAAAQTASTATAATANYQTAAFVTPYVIKGPGKYFILMQNSGSNHYRAWPLGNFGASVKTAETFGTFTAVTPPTTFTADVGLIADLY